MNPFGPDQLYAIPSSDDTELNNRVDNVPSVQSSISVSTVNITGLSSISISIEAVALHPLLVEISTA